MGGCVSAPKEIALNEGDVAPLETPTTPKNAEGDNVVAQEASQEVAEKKEEPLVDLTEAKEEKVEAEVEEAKVEEAKVAADEIKEPAKEEAKEEQPKVEEALAEQPKEEEKNEAPLVIV